MSEHEIPTSHLKLLQAILMALYLHSDPDATFVIEPTPDPEVEEKPTIGK